MMDVNDIERLFKAHFSQMQRLAMALLHDEDIARDIVHDVFARLLDCSQGGPVGPGYLMMAVRNHCLNHIRACEIRERVAKLYFHDNDVYASESWPDEETITLIFDPIGDITTGASRNRAALYRRLALFGDRSCHGYQ